MPSAAHPRIPHKHSTAQHPPRDEATRLSHAASPHHRPLSTPASQPTSPASPAVDKVDSQARTVATTAKARAHSRLTSIGRLRSRGSVPQQQQQQQQHQSTQPASLGEPVSPLDAGSPHKLSDASTLSNSSSATTLSDDARNEKRSIEEQPSRPSFWLASGNVLGDINKDPTLYDGAFDPVNIAQAARDKQRMMHQTSSKLLRMTDDERPFTKDFTDLFATLMVSLPLTPHRVRFSRVEHTFTSEEAMTNLGSLKFSQSNRMPDPKDPSRIVTTTTTTTFSMAKEMARSVCQRFLDARFIESVDGKSDFHSRSAVWQLTPKGMHILGRFCQRNGIHQRHVNDLLDSPRNMMLLVILERDPETDKISSDAATVGVIFRRFAGDTGPNLKSNSTASDTDSLNDYATGLIGVKMQRSRRGDRESPYVFIGKSAYDWLMDCCTLVDKREVFELGNLFITQGLIQPTNDEKSTNQSGNVRFMASKQVSYSVTQKGMRVAGWVTSPNGSVNGDATAKQRMPAGVSRDSNTNRLAVIVRDPALRLLFREYLRETHCEENLAFYVEVKIFLADYESAKRVSSPPKPDVIRETLASAYSLYNAFLAPGSPCELNIDHNLRNALAGRMTKAVGEDEQMLTSLDEVAILFDQAQSTVFKLMASDSVPKFSREPKYANVLKERNVESMLTSFASTSIS